MIAQLLNAGLGQTIDSVLARFFPDKEKAAEAAQALRLAMIDQEKTLRLAARDVIVAEAKSTHWVTSAWRPITMLVFTAIIANNYILAPYLAMLFGVSVELELPEPLWELVKIGLGGYVVGRSAEKVAAEWRRG